MTRLVLFELFVTNLLLFEHQQKDGSLADSFLDPSSGWRKVVVNRYLEFDRVPRPYETCQKKALQCTLTDRKESKVQSAPGIILNRYRADHSLSIEKPRSAVKGAKAAPWHPGGQWEAPQQFRFMFMFRKQSLDCSALPGTDCGLQLRQTAPQRDVSAWSQRRWMLLISWSFASVS